MQLTLFKYLIIATVVPSLYAAYLHVYRYLRSFTSRTLWPMVWRKNLHASNCPIMCVDHYDLCVCYSTVHTCPTWEETRKTSEVNRRLIEIVMVMTCKVKRHMHTQNNMFGPPRAAPPVGPSLSAITALISGLPSTGHGELAKNNHQSAPRQGSLARLHIHDT